MKNPHPATGPGREAGDVRVGGDVVGEEGPEAAGPKRRRAPGPWREGVHHRRRLKVGRGGGGTVSIRWPVSGRAIGTQIPTLILPTKWRGQMSLHDAPEP